MLGFIQKLREIFHKLVVIVHYMDKFQYNMTVLNVEHLKHVISK
jgi:hypothetical protein